MARMRAIEQHRFLVRSANTGISGIVDPYGRIVERSNLFEPAVLTADVRLLTERPLPFTGGVLFEAKMILLALVPAAIIPRRRYY
jgi:apolipoprotein N-acyltransferase